jgi:hypothetical protein
MLPPWTLSRWYLGLWRAVKLPLDCTHKHYTYLLNNWGKSAQAPVSGAFSPRNIEMIPLYYLLLFPATWHGGKFIAEWASADIYADLRRVFARLDADDGWWAMQARLDLFHRLAREVATRLGFDYPEALASSIAGYITDLRKG